MEVLYSSSRKNVTMKYKLDKGAHSVHSLHYHLIFVVKYRRKVFTNDKIIDFLKQKIHEISGTFDVEVLAIECDVDHIHILKAKQTLDIPHQRSENDNFKGDKAEVPRRSCGKILVSVILATTGQVTLDVLNVESQGENDAD